MSTTDLPDLYTRVVAKRPELAVHTSCPDPNHFTWLPCELQHNHNGDGLWRLHEVDHEHGAAYAMFDPYPEEFAAALILARWVVALPPLHTLCHFWEGWEVHETTGGEYRASGRPWSPTPIEALAAFYLETTDHATGGAK